MYIVIKSAEKKSSGPWIKSGVRQPPDIHGRNEDYTTKTVIEAKWTLQELESAIAWARIGVEPGRLSIYVAC